MFKLVKMETASGTEAILNKLQEDGWRVAGCGPDYIVLTDTPNVTVKRARRRFEDDGELSMNIRRYLRENADLSREVEDLRKRLAATEDEDATTHWDGMRKIRDLYKHVAGELFEALCWASGASDFSPGDEAAGVAAGQAREGWERGPRKAMEAYQEAQRLEREGNRER